MTVARNKDIDVKLLIDGRFYSLTDAILSMSATDADLNHYEITLNAEICPLNIQEVTPGEHFLYMGVEYICAEQQGAMDEKTIAIDIRPAGQSDDIAPAENTIFSRNTPVVPVPSGCDNSQMTTPPKSVIPPSIDFEAAGHKVGVECQDFMRGFLRGMADAMEAPDPISAAVANTELFNAENPQQIEKTTLTDCCRCWCNECADIEICETYNFDTFNITDDAVDSYRPAPCRGCEEGAIGQPKHNGTTKSAPTCGGFLRGESCNYG
jgi:hypothetical protein